jgi:hypothetical protein
VDNKKLFLAIAPYLGAAATGSVIGGAISDNRGSGATKGALIALGSLAGGNVALKAGKSLSKKIYGEKLQLAEKLYENISKSNDHNGMAKTIIDFLVEKNLSDEANKFAQTFISSGNVSKSLDTLTGESRKLITKLIPLNYYHKVLSKAALVSGGAQTLGSGLGLSGTAYALKNDPNKKK